MRTLLFISLFGLLVCGQPATEKAEQDRLLNQVYFTKDDPGRWKDFAKDHEPLVKQISPGQVEVDIAMQADPGHYIEVIVTTDAAGREIAAQRFKRGEKPHAKLAIPREKMPGASAIAKCNLHGMWKKEIQ